MSSKSREWSDDEWLSIWESYYRVRPIIDIRAASFFPASKRVPAAVTKTVTYANTSSQAVIVYDTGLLGTTYVPADTVLHSYENSSDVQKDFLYIVMDITCAKKDVIRWKRSAKMTSMSGNDYDDMIVIKAYEHVVREDELMKHGPHYLSARQGWMTVRFEIDVDIRALENNECLGLDIAGLNLAFTLDDITERSEHRGRRRNPIRDMFDELSRRRAQEGQIYAYYEQSSIQRCKYFCVGDTIYELMSSRVSPMKDRRVGPPGVYRHTPSGPVLIEPKDYCRNAIFDTAEEAKHYVDIVVRAAGDTEYQRKLHFDKLKADAEERKAEADERRAEQERRRDRGEKYDKANEALKSVSLIVGGIASIVGILMATKKK